MFKWCKEECKEKGRKKGNNLSEENCLLFSHFPPFECADVLSKFFDTQLFCYFLLHLFQCYYLTAAMSPESRTTKCVFESVFISIAWNYKYKTMCNILCSWLWEICDRAHCHENIRYQYSGTDCLTLWCFISCDLAYVFKHSSKGLRSVVRLSEVGIFSSLFMCFVWNLWKGGDAMRILADKMMFTGGAHSKKRSTSTTAHQKRYGLTQDRCEKGRMSYQEVTPLNPLLCYVNVGLGLTACVWFLM